MQMQPIVDGLRDEFQDGMVFVYLNAEEEGRAAFSRLSLPGHPAYVILSDSGEQQFRAFGMVTPESLRQAIISYLVVPES